MNTFVMLKGAFLGGTATWLTLIAFNNITDPNTNLGLLYRMFSMDGVTPDSAMGGGLVRRAIKSERLPRLVLTLVIAYQLLTAGVMLRAAYTLTGVGFGWRAATSLDWELANAALLLFAAMWFAFLCGGLWFGYWITMPSVQTVHLLMLIATLGLALLVNA